MKIDGGQPAAGLTGTVTSALSTTYLQAAAEAIAIPAGFDLLHAAFLRQGPDLLLEAPDGAQVLIIDYFREAEPAALTTADGASLRGDLIAKLAGPMAPGQVAQAGDVAALGEPIGEIDSVSGTVTIIRADGTSVTAQAGDAVFMGDQVVTGGDGRIVIVFVDSSALTIDADSRMVLDELIYDPATGEGESLFSALTGVFAFVSGDIAANSPGEATIDTPVATIGIRGTSFVFSFGPQGLQVALQPDANGTVGEIVLSNDLGDTVISEVGDIYNVNDLSVEPVVVEATAEALAAAGFSPAVVAALLQAAQAAQAAYIEDQAEQDDIEGEAGGGADMTDDRLENEYQEQGLQESEESDPGDAASNLDPSSESDDGGTGDDTIVGGLGNATIEPVIVINPLPTLGTGDGGDSIIGGLGNDTVLGPPAGQNLVGGDLTDDNIVGGAGADMIDGKGGNDVIDGGSGDDVLVGGTGADNIKGGAGADKASGGDGDDTISGGAGNDSLIGDSGIGNDLIFGDEDDDSLGGEAGNDTLVGGTGHDIAFGGSGNDSLVGGDGLDTLNGGAGDDILRGGIGADVANGDSGNDDIDGEAGNDSLAGGAGNDTVKGGAGDDLIDGDGGFGGFGSGVLLASNGATGNLGDLLVIDADTGAILENIGPIGFSITGLAVDPTTGILYGTTTNRDPTNPGSLIQIDPDTGAGTLIGSLGIGSETAAGLTFRADGTLFGWAEAGSDDLVTIDLATGQATFLGVNNVSSAGAGLAFTPDGTLYLVGNNSFQLAIIDPVTGNRIDTVDYIDEFGNFISISAKGALASDADGLLYAVVDDGSFPTDRALVSIDPATGEVITLGEAPALTDALVFAAGEAIGDDSLVGGAGNDILMVNTAADTVDGGTGQDTIKNDGIPDDYNLISGSQELSAQWTGFETLDITNSESNLVEINSAAMATIAPEGETLSVLGNVGDSVAGSGWVLTASTVAGFEAFTDGTFTLLVDQDIDRTGLSQDLPLILIGTAGDDFLVGAGNDDSIDGLGGFDTLDGLGGNDTLIGGTENDSLLGGAGDDLIIAGTNAPGADDDFADGGDGDDTISGGTGNDSLIGGLGNDSVLGGIDNDSILGGDGNDIVSGGTGNDSVLGGDGDDVLFSGPVGSDTLRGGLGNDTFLHGGGTDSLFGDDGDDTFQPIRTAATIDGGSGVDAVHVAPGQGSLSLISGTLGTVVNWVNIEAITMRPGEANGLQINAANMATVAPEGDTLTINGDGDDTVEGVGWTETGTVGGFTAYTDGGTFTLLVDTDIDRSGLAPGAAPQTVIGTAGDDTLVGDSGDDSIIGLAGDDSLVGLAGNDTLDDADGFDTLLGGAGDDSIIASNFDFGAGIGEDFVDGGAGNDTILSEQNTGPGDTLLGGDGNDSIQGTFGADSIDGGDGDDTLSGGPNNDIVAGGAGNDGLASGNSDDTLLGGDGNDVLSGNAQDNLMDGGAGNDTIAALVAHTVIGGTGSADEVLVFNAAQGSFDLISGTLGADANWTGIERINMATGDNERVQINAANMAIVAPEGDTLTILSDSIDADTVEGNGWTVVGSAAGFTEYTDGGTFTLLVDDNIDQSGIVGDVPQTLVGDDSINDFLIGGNEADVISGLGGNDTLVGSAGDDTINGGTGLDSLVGGLDDDLLDGDADDDQLQGQGGNDTLIGDSGNDTLTAGNGNDILSGGTGNDSMLGGGDDDSIVGGDNNDFLSGAGGQDTMLGEAGDDFMTGGTEPDSIDGGAGNDTLVGGAGADTMLGNFGDDSLKADGSDDLLIGGDGDDSLFGGSGNDTLNGAGFNDGLNVLDGGAGNDSLSSESGGDSNERYVFRDGDGDDTIFEEAGAADSDTIDFDIGGAGDSFLFGTSRNGSNLVILHGDGGLNKIEVSGHFGAQAVEFVDNSQAADFNGIAGQVYGIASGLIGGAGNDLITGDDDTTFLSGGGGNDWLSGQPNTDESIEGGAGDDVLLGDAGNDTLIGDTGEDLLRPGDGIDSLAPGGADGADDFIVYDNITDLENQASNDTFAGATDAIVGFTLSEDKIVFTGGTFGLSDVTTGTNFSVIGTAYDGTNPGTNTAHGAGDTALIYDSVAGTLYLDQDGAAAGYEVVATFAGTPLLTDAEFDVV